MQPQPTVTRPARYAGSDLSVGTYSIPAGGTDDQAPHDENEISVVIGGRAILNGDCATAAVRAGSVIYVRAGENHTFTRIEDLTLLVIFAPAHGSRQR